MRARHRGYEIEVERPRGICAGQWLIVDLRDNEVLAGGPYDGTPSVGEMVRELKARIDAELVSMDPWGGAANRRRSMRAMP